METAKRLAALAVALTVAAAAAAAEKRPFELYQGIIDCEPFGPPPEDPAVDPATISRSDGKGGPAGADEKAQEKQQSEMEKAVSVSVMNIGPDGKVMVGFTDSSSKPPVHHYLAVGVERGGWLVKSADPVKKSVVLSKDGVEIERTVGKGDSGGAKGSAKADGADSQKAVPRRGSPLLGSGSIRSRRAQKEAEREADREAQKAAFEELRRQRDEEEARRQEEKAMREADQEALRENLRSIQEQLKQNRERRLRENSEAEGAGGETEEQS
jgi:hypothetical protein